MATTPTPLQLTALADLSLDLSAAPTWWPKPQGCNTIWNTSFGNWPNAPTPPVSPLEKPPHD